MQYEKLERRGQKEIVKVLYQHLNGSAMNQRVFETKPGYPAPASRTSKYNLDMLLVRLSVLAATSTPAVVLTLSIHTLFHQSLKVQGLRTQ